MQNGLIDPVTLSFDLSIQKAYRFEYIPLEVIPYTKFEHFGITRF